MIAWKLKGWYPMKLESQPLYPLSKYAKGILTNMVLNLTPDGKFQVARVLKPGGPAEGDFEVLLEGSEIECENFWSNQVRNDFPGLID
jgi:hypothetical protein